MARTKKVTPVSFFRAIKNYWLGYVDFQGVSTRREYWYAWLFRAIVLFVCLMFPSRMLWSVVGAVMFLPSRALSFRRFHDAGLSGWWYLGPTIFLPAYCVIRDEYWMFALNLDYVPLDMIFIMFLCVAYLFELLIVFVQPTKEKNNKYRP